MRYEQLDVDSMMASTGATVYRFGEFQLRPLARELTRDGKAVELAASAFDCLVYLIEHRERPVGKDELISAVWGRADVSDNLLAQTIVRLRRALGDAGNEQRCIKTIARVGYRWMLDITASSEGSVSVQSTETGHAPTRHDTRAVHGRRMLAAGLLLALLAVAIGWGWHVRRSGQTQARALIRLDNSAAIVLPVEVAAPDEWKWLGLGLMDLVSERLRAAGIATETPQEVLELLQQRGDRAGDDFSSFGLVVKLRVEQAGSRWQVRMDAKARDGRAWHAESSAQDVLAAARAASDLLLAQLGTGAARETGGPQDEYLLRIEAAQLAGQTEMARELINRAPASLRDNPELAYNLAALDCQVRKFDACEQRLTALLKQLSDRQPLLRGKVLTRLWFVYNNKQRYAEGDAVLTEAIHLLQKQNDPAALATAYLTYSHLKYYQGKWDDATALLGQARVSYQLAGDAVGLVKVDYAMALLAEHRGQLETTVTLLKSVSEQCQRLGMRVMHPYVLSGLVRAQRTLLRYSDALATTEQFWPLDQKDVGVLTDDIRLELTLVRALALADNGNTTEAATLMEGIFNRADPDKFADYRGEIAMSLTWLSLQRQDDESAALWSSRTMQFIAADDDPRDGAQARLYRIATLQRLGRAADVEHEVAAMETWVAGQSADDAVAIRLMHARAIRALVQGKREDAFAQFALAMSASEKLGNPDIIVSVGTAYALALLDAGQLDRGMAIGGRLGTWSNVDWRAAWVEARMYQALGQNASWELSRGKAKQLAGDRPLPVVSAGMF